MSKQSARLYYRGKDHKDIYFDGEYHCAMYKEGDLVWFKGLDGKYLSLTSYVSSGYWHYVVTTFDPITKEITRKEINGPSDLQFAEKMNFGRVTASYGVYVRYIFPLRLGSCFHRITLDKQYRSSVGISNGRVFLNDVDNASNWYIGTFNEDLTDISISHFADISADMSANQWYAAPQNGGRWYIFSRSSSGTATITLLDTETGAKHSYSFQGTYIPTRYIQDSKRFIGLFGNVCVCFDGSFHSQTIASGYSASNMSLYENNGTYYIATYSNTGSTIYTSANGISWVAHQKTGYIRVPFTNAQSSQYKTLQINFQNGNPTTSDCFNANINTIAQGASKAFYKEGELATSEHIFFDTSIYSLGSIDIGLYIDSPLFTDSSENVAFYKQ